jgi:homoserine kinase type II
VLQRLRGKPAAIVSFLDGRAAYHPDPHHCREGGEALARLHLAGAGFPGHRANDLGHQAWAALFEGREDEAEALRPGLVEAVRADLDELARDWPAGLPQGTIHADLFPDNVFFTEGRFSGAIDFYFACNDLLAYDLAVTLNAWCFPEDRFDPIRAKALVDGYERVRALSAAEREALPVLARGAAMRFFLTRLIDWTSTPEGALVTRKNPLEYADKLAFYRQAGASTAKLGLAA